MQREQQEQKNEGQIHTVDSASMENSNEDGQRGERRGKIQGWPMVKQKGHAKWLLFSSTCVESYVSPLSVGMAAALDLLSDLLPPTASLLWRLVLVGQRSLWRRSYSSYCTTSQAIHGLSHLRTQKGSPFTLKGNNSVSRFMSLSLSPGGQKKARPPDTTPYYLPYPLHSHVCKLFPERTPSVNRKPLTSCLRLHLERNSLKILGNKVIRFVF